MVSGRTTEVEVTRPTWQAAREAVEAFPSYQEAIPAGETVPPEEWFHDISTAEIAEAQARHAYQRAELAEHPDPVGEWPLTVIRSAFITAITETFTSPKVADELMGRLAAALDLYGDDPDELLDLADRHRVTFMVVTAGLRAVLPPGEIRDAAHRLTEAIGVTIEHPGEAIMPAVNQAGVYIKTCANAKCSRGPDGGPATFAPKDNNPGQRMCSHACRQQDLRSRQAAERRATKRK